MAGIALLAGYLLLGVVAGEGLFREKGRMTRLWLGLTVGFAMMMWLPSLWAFFMDFTVKANGFALGTAAALSAAAYLYGRRRQVRLAVQSEDEPPLRMALWLALPAVALFAAMQYTHYFREADGALYVGQSTFGDVCMHSAIITSLQNAAYPPEYSILPGSRLGYPFLGDALSASMLLFGTPLSLCMTIPGTLMGGMVFWGFLMLGWKLTGERRAVVVAFLLLFLNGGLGFLYSFDMVGEDSSAALAIFTEYYQAPANMPLLNLRWVNVVCDMLLPQRTFLAGCMVFLPALYLLTDAYERREARLRMPCAESLRAERRAFLRLGALAGAMPMIHTHLFLTLGLITAGMMAYTAVRERGARAMSGYLLYGSVAVAMAAPQLLLWTLPQTSGAGGVRLWLGWVNNEGGGLRDETIWFWVKNMGLPFLLLIPSAMQTDARGRALALGAALAFAVGNLFQFQTLLYDNNKILYGAYIVFCPLLGAYVVRVYDALKAVRGRALLAACFLIASLASGALSVGRELVSNYQIFSASEARAAEYLKEETEARATVLTGNQHNNLATVLAGKNVVCGPLNFLYTHGLDYNARYADAKAMFETPAASADLFEKYSVNYVLISSYERGQYALDEDWFVQNGECVYDDGLQIYRLG